jgi:glutamate N-acetyltransferase/amino-acid N-acetyltransferase
VGQADYHRFVDALREVCLELALGIVRGGEGATKLVTVRVTGGATDACARKAARAIANSPLVKTAIHGGDPNWGRLVAVAGRSGAHFDLGGARVEVGGVVLFEQGRPFDERAAQAAAHLQGKDVSVLVDLGTGGPHEARIFTCDFSADYVKINAEYRT